MESNTYMVAGQTFELKHYGVKGMKWGKRKAQEEYRKLDKARQEYRRAGRIYRRTAKTTLKNEVMTAGHAYASRKLMNAHKKDYNDAKKAYKDQKKNVRANTTGGQKMAHAAKQIPKIMGKVGTAYVTDQVFFGGMGTKAVTSAVKGIGMLTITAYTKARGGYDIHWYDKQGRKIV